MLIYISWLSFYCFLLFDCRENITNPLSFHKISSTNFSKHSLLVLFKFPNEDFDK